MQKWEYMTLSNAATMKLNEAGAKGWELVSALSGPTGDIYFIFKRPLPETI